MALVFEIPATSKILASIWLQCTSYLTAKKEDVARNALTAFEPRLNGVNISKMRLALSLYVV